MLMTHLRSIIIYNVAYSLNVHHTILGKICSALVNQYWLIIIIIVISANYFKTTNDDQGLITYIRIMKMDDEMAKLQ